MLQDLFVYGTLKRGFPLHFVLQDEIYCGEARTVAQFRLYDAGEWPVLVECADGIAVHGELYRVTQRCLDRCDEVEGVAAGLYERRLAELSTPGSDEISPRHAWCYFYLRSTQDMTDCGCRWPQ